MPNQVKKGVGINPNPHVQIHYLDHLAVICYIMDIPLILVDEQEYTFAKKYYPGVDVRRLSYEEFTPEYLVSNFDVFFMSDLWDRRSFHEKYGALEKKYGKQLRHVHCPHGFSDKGFYLYKCAFEDILLAYGQNMLDFMKYFGVAEKLAYRVLTGNYRYTYYKMNRVFYDHLVQTEVLSHFEQKKPVVLYAPTWLDSDQTTTFFDACSQILDRLPSEYNVIVKLHPNLESGDPASYYSILGKYEDRKNIVFLKDYPIVYPLLAHTDIYIGDMSAVGYDFLTFNKPMFFLNKKRLKSIEDRVLLYLCGVEIFPEQYTEIFSIIEDHLAEDQERFGKIRKEIYQYTFGSERPFAEIKADIITAYTAEYIN